MDTLSHSQDRKVPAEETEGTGRSGEDGRPEQEDDHRLPGAGKSTGHENHCGKGRAGSRVPEDPAAALPAPVRETGRQVPSVSRRKTQGWS